MDNGDVQNGDVFRIGPYMSLGAQPEFLSYSAWRHRTASPGFVCMAPPSLFAWTPAVSLVFLCCLFVVDIRFVLWQ